MPLQPSDEMIGNVTSPGGFVFGVQGWTWGEPKPQSITFFLDGTAKVSDQHGRPIKGATSDNKEIWFAVAPPREDDKPDQDGNLPPHRRKYATHAQVINALESNGHQWRKCSWAGWPQLPYAELCKIKSLLPPTPIEELRKIRDDNLRKDALRIRREIIEAEEMEAEQLQEE